MDSAVVDRKKKKRSERIETKIDYIPKQAGHGNPYVAYFPSGFDPLQEKVDDDDYQSCPRAQFLSYVNSRPKSRQEELVVRTPEEVDFVGSNYGGEAVGWQPCDYLLGVFDKETKSLKLVPLAGDKVFRMEPRVRGHDYGLAVDGEAIVEEEGNTAELNKIKKRMLTEAFGSQKSRLRAARYERAQVTENDLGDFTEIESLFQEAADNKVLLTTEQAMEQVNKDLVRNVPPYDLNATTPQTAYVLDKIITPDEWEVLDVKELKSAALKSTLEQSLRLNNAYPGFVFDRLNRLKVEGDTEGNQRRAHILMYMKHLLAFHYAPQSTIKRAADPWGSSGGSTVDLTEALGIPGPIVAKFLEVFTTKGVDRIKPGGLQRNKEHVELCIGYILVLGLMVDEFQADPHDLAVELKMSVLALKPHYQEIGCKYEQRKTFEKQKAGVDANSAKLKWKVTLPIPLRFPKLENKSRQRRR